MNIQSNRKWYIIGGVVLIVGIIILWSYLAGKNSSPFETVKVTRGNVTEEVSATGNVKPIKSVDLAFEKSGRIAAVNADVGDTVYAGEAIVVLDKSDLQTQLAKAQADLATGNANLDKAKIDLVNYYGDAVNILSNAYAASDDAVRTKTSSLFSGSQASGYQLTFLPCDNQAAIDAKTLRLQSDTELIAWQNELVSLTPSSTPVALNAALKNAGRRLNIFKSFLERINANLVNPCFLGNASYDTARANLTTARTNVISALTDVTTEEQSISAQDATIISLAASVRSYEAAIENIKAQLVKTTIYAPLSGVVTVQNAKVGEIASANGAMTSIISTNRLETEANIAEADIAKVKVGDQTEITLDAYGNDIIFDAKVSFVDPAETMVEGVATYRTKFQFLKEDDRIKSGMTANITILTDMRENVLVIPQRSVAAKDGEKSVLIDLGGGKSEERKITTGLKGSDGNVEVIQGLNEGDVVIINNNS